MKTRETKPVIFLFTFPLQGHLNPMFQLATIFFNKGFSITVIHTEFNSPNSSSFPHFTFVSIPDGLSESEASNPDVIEILHDLNSKCVAPFGDFLKKLISQEPTATCVIVDALWYFTDGLTEKFGIPRIVLRTVNISAFVAFSKFHVLRDQGYLSLQGQKPVMSVSVRNFLSFASVPMSNILCSTAVHHATSVMSSKLMDATLTGDLVLCLVKGTFNDHFYDGEKAATAARRVFQSTGLKSMLVYGVERTEDGDPCDYNIEKFIETIEGAKTLSTSHLSSVVIKITDICSVSLLKRVSDLLRWQYKNPNFKLPWRLNSFPVFSGLSHDATSEPEPLTLEEEQELEKANQRLKSISQKCQESNILLLIEAEDTTLQPAIDYMTYWSSCLPPPPLSPPPLPPSLSSLPLSSPPPPQQPSSSVNQQSNSFSNIAPPHPLNLSNHVPDHHHMDTLSWAALGYCFTACIAFNTIFAQVANPNNVSFRIKLMSQLIYVACNLLIAANGIFARTHPTLAFYMDRIGSVTVLLASTIAVPTIPVYVSIGLPVFMIIVWAHQHYFHS